MSDALLHARRRVALLDEMRTPYAIDAGARANLVGARGAIHWPEAAVLAKAPLVGLDLEGVRVFARTIDARATARTLDRLGGDWNCTAPLLDPAGLVVGGIWQQTGGDVFLPFDPDQARNALLHEEYLEVTVGRAHRRLREGAHRAYYRMRSAIPRKLQLAMRRRYLVAQNRLEFPAWPVETALHGLDALVLALVEEVAGEPLPWVAPWPDPYGWAFVLTHDIEGPDGYERLDAVLEREAERGLRSACFFVPERGYEVDFARLEDLRGRGFEVGLHGLRHDGRDLAEGDFEERLPAMRSFAAAWGAVGFRSPATHRDRDRLARLGVSYDSTYSDVARFEPQPGGSCSWLPYFLGPLVELPITMPMDHLVFDLFGHQSDELWATKGAALRENGGMALLLTHPDYLLDDDRLDVYSTFLDRWADDNTAWRALPRDVAAWWRERADCRLERDGSTWRAVGAAASRARVMLGSPSRPTGVASLEERSPASSACAAAGLIGWIQVATEVGSSFS